MMIRTQIEIVADDLDQEIAQIVHRVQVARITLTMLDGTEVSYERSEHNMDSAMFCPDCHQLTIWDEDIQDYRHHPMNEVTHRCWLRKGARRLGEGAS